MKHSKTKFMPKAARSLPALTFCFLFAACCLAPGEEAGLPAPAREVNKYALTSTYDYPAHDPKAWRLLASNDGGHSWTTLDVRTNEFFSRRNETREFVITNETAYNTYRLVVDAANGPGTNAADTDSSVQLSKLNLTGPITGVTNESDLRTVITSSRAHPLIGPPENAFDNDLSTRWMDFGLGSEGGCWIQCRYVLQSELLVTNINQLQILARLTATRDSLLQSGRQILSNLTAQSGKPFRAIKGYALTSANDEPARDPRTWRLLGSNNGGKSWETLDVRHDEVFTSRFQRRVFGLARATAFELYRFEIAEVGATNGLAQLAEIEPLYPEAETNSRFSMVVCAQADNPPMQSVDMAFDGDPKTKWFSFAEVGAARPAWLQWRYIPERQGLPVINLTRLKYLMDRTSEILPYLTAQATNCIHALTGYALTSANDQPARDPRDWRLLGSNDDGKTWDVLDTRTNEAFTSRFQKRTFTLAHTATCVRYRLEISSVATPKSANSVQLAEVEPLYASTEDSARYSVVVSAQGDNPPNEAAEKVFDGNPKTKWLDFAPGSTNRASWIQWQYAAGQDSAVINLDELHDARPWKPRLMKLDLTGVVLAVNPSSDRIVFLDETGGQWLDMGSPVAGVRPGDQVRLTGQVQFGNLQLIVLNPEFVSQGTVAAVSEVVPEEPFTADQRFISGTVEGRATSLARGQFYSTIRLEMENGSGHIFANILSPRRLPVPSTLDCRLKVEGVVEPIFNEKGERVAGAIWVAGLNDVALAVPTEKEWSSWPVYSADDPSQTNLPQRTLVRARGTLVEQHPGESLVLAQGTNQLVVYSKQTNSLPPGAMIEAAGFLGRQAGKPVLNLAYTREAKTDAISVASATPLLIDEQHPVTRIRQIRELIKNGPVKPFPAKVRGVITYMDLGLSTFYLQDGADSIPVHGQLSAGLYPMQHEEGMYVELQAMVEGEEVRPTAFVNLIGKGRMPEPLRHSWDYLMTGKGDGLWVQMDGIISGNEKQRLILNVPGGQFIVWINETDRTTQNRLPGSMVRISGVCSPVVNNHNQRLGLRLLVPSSEYVEILSAPPTNPFDLPTVPIRAVMQSDPENAGSTVQMVKTTGILTYRGPYGPHAQLFVQDGKNGLRAFARRDTTVEPGDQVEVVGFVQPDGFSPKMTEALVWKVKNASLPAADPIDLLDAEISRQDATRGHLEATFLGESTRDSLRLLEFRHEKTQRGFTVFLPGGKELPDMPPGSRVRLEGIFKAKTETVPDFDQGVGMFEMYLNSPGDMVVLERPPWWTARHTVWLMEGLAGVLFLSLVWAGLLRKQVRQGTRVLHDEIEERKRAEEALRESQVVYHSLVEHLPIIIYRKDSEGRFVFANSRYCEFKGIMADQIIGKTALETGCDDALARQCDEADRMIMRTGKSIETEEEHLDYAKRRRVFQVVKMPVFGSDQKNVGTQGLFFEITQRKQAEVELAYERDLLRLLMDNSPDCIYFKDEQSRFIRCSRAMWERAGMKPEEIVGKTDFDLYSEEHARPAFEDEQAIIRSGQPIIGKIEKEVFKDGRETWALTSKMPLRNEANQMIGTLGISKDITAIKEAEAKLGEVNRKLVESSRLAGMAEVATSVLHNVGNVLNSVNISSSLVADKVHKSKVANLAKAAALMQANAGDLPGFFARDPKGRQLPAYLATLAEHLSGEQQEILTELASLRSNIEHIKEVVSMQQSYAKISGATEAMPIEGLVEDALRMNAAAVENHQIEVVREYSPVPPVQLDKHKVLQILVNLIRNAKYALEDNEPGNKRMTLQVRANGHGTVKVMVRDNGMGIPPENLARIFEHGFTTRKEGHGFGLHSGALAAREMGGSLSVHSDGPGKGATFTLELPHRAEERVMI